jgi:molybdopterin synthase catalytic subunit
LDLVIEITHEEPDITAIIAQITRETTGAVCIFTGMVRGVTSHGNAYLTQYLEYESYDSMAKEKLHEIADEMSIRWPSVEGIALVQRVGKLEPHKIAVVIACAAAHRDTGVFEAARFGIDRLKAVVPIWKIEVMPDGELWIEGDHLPPGGNA